MGLKKDMRQLEADIASKEAELESYKKNIKDLNVEMFGIIHKINLLNTYINDAAKDYTKQIGYTQAGYPIFVNGMVRECTIELSQYKEKRNALETKMNKLKVEAEELTTLVNNLRTELKVLSAKLALKTENKEVVKLYDRIVQLMVLASSLFKASNGVSEGYRVFIDSPNNCVIIKHFEDLKNREGNPITPTVQVARYEPLKVYYAWLLANEVGYEFDMGLDEDQARIVIRIPEDIGWN